MNKWHTCLLLMLGLLASGWFNAVAAQPPGTEEGNAMSQRGQAFGKQMAQRGAAFGKRMGAQGQAIGLSKGQNAAQASQKMQQQAQEFGQSMKQAGQSFGQQMKQAGPAFGKQQAQSAGGRDVEDAEEDQQERLREAQEQRQEAQEPRREAQQPRVLPPANRRQPMSSLPLQLQSPVVDVLQQRPLGVAAFANNLPAMPRIQVVFQSPTVVQIRSTLDVSNVVLEFPDSTQQRFNNLQGRTGLLAGTGMHAGKPIRTVWVKSGMNLSVDGPGYGQRFDYETILATTRSLR